MLPVGTTTIVTSAGATVLTNLSTTAQVFTGSQIQTVRLPDATTLDVGDTLSIVNQSSHGLYLQYSDADPFVRNCNSRSTLQLTLTDNSTPDGVWELSDPPLPLSASAFVNSDRSIEYQINDPIEAPVTQNGTDTYRINTIQGLFFNKIVVSITPFGNAYIPEIFTFVQPEDQNGSGTIDVRFTDLNGDVQLTDFVITITGT